MRAILRQIGRMFGHGPDTAHPDEDDDPTLSTTPDQPIPFGYKTSWLAIRSDDTKAVFESLCNGNARHANWETGARCAMEGAATGKTLVFVAPPINGWTLVLTGLGLGADSSENVARLQARLQQLSTRFGEAQYFGSYRVVDYVAWFRAVGGEIARGFSYADGTLFANVGQTTAAEKDAGLPEMSGMQIDALLKAAEGAEIHFANETNPMRIAEGWSVNPLHLDALASQERSVGLMGTLAASPTDTAQTGEEIAAPFRVFYELYDSTHSVGPDHATHMDQGDWMPIARQVARTPNAFIGFIDAHDLTLQFYCNGEDALSLSVPVPTRKGELAADINLAGYREILQNMTAPLSGYIKTLPVEFREW